MWGRQFRKWLSFFGRSAPWLLLVSAAGAETPLERLPPDPGASHWQRLARLDLAAVRQTLLAAHPGVIDAQNPDFGDWLERGYHEAETLLPSVFSYDSAMAAVRYYVSGFRDGHLFYSDHARGESRMYVSGWAAAYRDGVARVISRATDWPMPLPPPGARLLGCDGLSPEQLIRERIAPFYDRQETGDGGASLLPFLQVQAPRGWEVQRCRFAAGDGDRTLDLDVSYQPVSVDQYFTFLRAQSLSARPREGNGFDLADGRLWVRVQNFVLSTEQAAALDTMLKALAELRGVQVVVFDTRGNGGGDSSVGQRIFDAVTGGQQFTAWTAEGLVPLYAQWRVSAVSIDTVERVHLRGALRRYGEGSEQAVKALSFLAALREAQAAGQPWVKQLAGFRLDRHEAEQRGARLARFDGRMVLLTDSECVSACLDFADTVLRVPGALHMGQTTGADTQYIDTARQVLPSGNQLIVPLKVWRNRLREPNQPLQPTLPLDLQRLDEVALRAAVFQAAQALKR